MGGCLQAKHVNTNNDLLAPNTSFREQNLFCHLLRTLSLPFFRSYYAFAIVGKPSREARSLPNIVRMYAPVGGDQIYYFNNKDVSLIFWGEVKSNYSWKIQISHILRVKEYIVVLTYPDNIFHIRPTIPTIFGMLLSP